MIRLTSAIRSSPKSIDSLTREIATARARQAGVTLREWLEQVVSLESLDQELSRGCARWDGQSRAGCEANEVTPIEMTKPALRLVQSGDPQAETTGPQMAAVARLAGIFGTICADPPEIVDPQADAHCTVPARARDIEPTEGEASESWAANDSAADTRRRFDASSEDLGARLPRTDEIGPQDMSFDGGTDQFLEGFLAQIDDMRAALATRVRDGTARRLDHIERTLHQMCADAGKAKQLALEAAGPFAERPGAAAHLKDRPSAAVEQLGAQVIRIVEAVEARFARDEVAGAQQLAELRAEISQLIEGLAAQISDFGRPAGRGDVDGDGPGSLSCSVTLFDSATGADVALLPELTWFEPGILTEVDGARDDEAWMPNNQEPLDPNDWTGSEAADWSFAAETYDAVPQRLTDHAADPAPGLSVDQRTEPKVAPLGTRRGRSARRSSRLKTVIATFGIAGSLSAAAAGYVLVAPAPANPVAESVVVAVSHVRADLLRLRPREPLSGPGLVAPPS